MRKLVVLLAAGVLLAGLPPAGAEITNPYPPVPEQDPVRLLVGFHPGTPDAERSSTHQQKQGTAETTLRPEGVDVVRIGGGDSVDQAISRYRSDPDVSFAEPNFRYTIDATPDDPRLAELWGLNNAGQSGGRSDGDIDAPEGWDLTNAASGNPWPTSDFAVGVVDTGVYSAHPDLANKIITPCFSALGGSGTLTQGCEDDHGHGSHVTGTIAAVGNNGQGVVGVAFNARVYVCKALNSSGSGSAADVAACINELVAKAGTYNIQVISLSLGGPASLTLEAAVAAAAAQGVLVVAAAGNNGNASLRYPAGYAAAVSVAATDRSDRRASFSNFNAKVEVAAPGVQVLSTVTPSGSLGSSTGYRTASGTSMAAPHVAAVAALIAWRSGSSGQALRDALAAATDDLGAAGRDQNFGFGRVNLCKALGGSCTYTPGPETSPTPPPSAEPSPAPAPSSPPARTPRPRRTRPRPSPEPTFGPVPTPPPGGAPPPGGRGMLSGGTFSGGIPRSKVRVAYSGARRGSTRTKIGGIYSIRVPSGRYALSATNGSVPCRAGSESGPTSVIVDVFNGDRQVVNWFC